MTFFKFFIIREMKYQTFVNDIVLLSTMISIQTE
jgi:hypothetical protein